MAAESSVRARSSLAAVAALLAALAIAVVCTTELGCLYPAPEPPTVPSVWPPTTAFEEEIFRFAEKELSDFEHATARRALVLPIAELATTAALVVAGLVVPRRRRVLGDALLMGGLFMQVWANAWVYQVYSPSGFGFLAERGSAPALSASVAGLAIVLYAGWWKYVRDPVSLEAEDEYGRLVRRFYSVFLAASLVHMFNVIWIHTYAGVNPRYSSPSEDSAISTWVASVLFPGPQYALPPVRLAYGAVLAGSGLLLRGTRCRRLASGVLLAGYLGLAMGVLGALMLRVDAAEFFWCVPVGLAALVGTALLHSKSPGSRSAGTS